MDESYLDSLLNEFSLDKEIDHKIEDELDEQIQNEKNRYQDEQTISREEAFNYDLEQDAIDGMPDNDFDFSEDQIDELDKLDNLADLDIGDLDFSDIDFDDLDITKLSGDIDDSDFDALLKDFEGDLEIPTLDDEDNDYNMADDNVDYSDADYNSDINGEPSTEYETQSNYHNEPIDNGNDEIRGDVTEDSPIEKNDFESDFKESSANLNEDNFDADSFLDSLLSEDSIEETTVDEGSSKDDNAENDNAENDNAENDNADGINNDDGVDSLDDLLNGIDSEDNNDGQFYESNVGEDMDYSEDDLFSMLEMHENGGGDNQYNTKVDNTEDDSAVSFSAVTESSDGAPDMSGLEGIEDIEDLSEKPKKKKKTFMEILFGEPDEDDEPTEEEIRAKEEKKAAKKAKKEAAKEKKKGQAEKNKEEKSRKDAEKKQINEKKRKIKAEKKAKRKAIEAAEALEAAKEKKLNKPAVIFIFSVLLGGVGFLYLSSIDFNYRIAIQQAANYFENQKYHKAYDEIKGVDVKEKDKPLKDRIYTVMYVERLYESYENNIELGRNKKALDSLLRGVSKYYEYYDDAKELDIVSDLDFSFAQIKNALEINYGITLERAMEINELDDYEYMKVIREYTGYQDEE